MGQRSFGLAGQRQCVRYQSMSIRSRNHREPKLLSLTAGGKRCHRRSRRSHSNLRAYVCRPAKNWHTTRRRCPGNIRTLKIHLSSSCKCIQKNSCEKTDWNTYSLSFLRVCTYYIYTYIYMALYTTPHRATAARRAAYLSMWTDIEKHKEAPMARPHVIRRGGEHQAEQKKRHWVI